MTKNVIFKKINLIVVIFVLFSMACNKTDDAGSNFLVGKNNFDNGWKFILDSLSGAENPAFNDSSWISVDLPHDWSVEDVDKKKDPDAIGPFSKKSPGAISTGHVIVIKILRVRKSALYLMAFTWFLKFG